MLLKLPKIGTVELKTYLDRYGMNRKRFENSPAESIVYGWNTELSDLTEPTPFDMTLNLTGGK